MTNLYNGCSKNLVIYVDKLYTFSLNINGDFSKSHIVMK